MKTWAELEGTKAKSSYKPCAGCGEPCARHAEFCRACSPNVRGANHYAWKGDAARSTTKRERAANTKLSGPCEKCGQPGTDRHHIDGNPGNNVPGNIELLCRRCHMGADGRLERLRQMFVPAKPAKPCVNCGKSEKYLRRGLCHACDERRRRAAARA